MDNADGGIPDVGRGSDEEFAGDDRVEFVKQEVERWREEGIVSERLADRLRAQYEPRSDTTPVEDAEDAWPRIRIPLSPGMVLLYLGGLLILTAGCMLATDVWDDLGRVGRLLLVLAPTIAAYAAALWLQEARPERRATALVLAFLGCLMAPFVLALALHLVLGYERADDRAWWVLIAALTVVVHLVSLWRFRSPLLTVPYPISLLWVGLATLETISGVDHTIKAFGVVLVLLGAILLPAGLISRLKGKRAYAFVPDLVGSLCFLGGFWVIGKEHDLPWMDLIALAVAVGAMWVSTRLRNQMYLLMGALFVIISIFSLGFGLFKGTAGLPLTLIICGGLSMGVGYAVQHLRREQITTG